jgi:cytochrome b6-f complex iron-sulfur subunit
MMETQNNSTTSITRRNLMKSLLGFSIVSTLAGVLTPIIGYLWPPARRTVAEGTRLRVGSLSELQGSGGLVSSANNEPIVLTYNQDGSVRAFSAICTHLACVVSWEAQGQYILCPCHDGRFNAQTGAVISGPPPTPLTAYEVVVEGDDIYIVAG